MKNIHILPTDKPSRLIKNNHSQLLLTIQTLPLDRELGCFPQHIYITSDEFIEEDDFGLNLSTKEIVKYNGVKGLNSCYKKIILTTDVDLIKDGVQAIDDEFLEYFVKNPSCEFINVELHVGSLRWSDSKNTYKIIIPKEESNPCKDIVINDKATIDVPFHNKHIRFENLTSEQAGYLLQVSEFYQLSGTRRSAVVPQEKQIKCYCGHTITCDCEPLQETLEEVAEMYIQSKNPQWTPYHKQSFKDGAKWQQEQILDFLYSEITERRPYSSSKMCEKVVEFIEQFKKK
jgi:hypothetical protein